MNVRAKLFVGGFPLETKQTDLVRLFSTVGAVFGVKLVVDRATGRSKGIAFVEMATEGDAKAARKKLDGAQLGGKRIFVVPAREKEEKPAPEPPRASPSVRYGAGPGMIDRRSGKDRRLGDRRRSSAPPPRKGPSFPRRRAS